MSGFADHFSGHAAAYARHRPRYPAALYDWLVPQVAGRGLAWDCASGNGQAVRPLCGRFRRVLATDASVEQLAQAPRVPGLVRAAALAEDPPLPPSSVDLVTVAQALHWFDHDAFFAQVRRVLRPTGVIAVWCYEMARTEPAVTAVIDRIYHEVVGDFWQPERRHIEAGYRSIDFPFDEVASPEFEMVVDWSLAELRGYIETWSASQRYWQAHGHSPLDASGDDLARVWGEPARRRAVVWPLRLRVGRR